MDILKQVVSWQTEPKEEWEEVKDSLVELIVPQTSMAPILNHLTVFMIQKQAELSEIHTKEKEPFKEQIWNNYNVLEIF